MEAYSQPEQSNRIETRPLTIGDLRRILSNIHEKFDSFMVMDATWSPISLLHDEAWTTPDVGVPSGTIKLHIR